MAKARKKRSKKARRKTSKRAGDKVVVSRAAYNKVVHMGAAHHSNLAALKRSARVLRGGKRKKARKKGRKKAARK